MGLFISNARVLHPQNKTARGTNAGTSITFSAPSTGIGTYLDKVTGFSDTTTVIEAKTALTGTLSTTSADETVTGTNTLFTTELEVGDIVKINDPVTSEYFTVATITDATHFEATVAASNNNSNKTANVIVGQTKVLAVSSVAEINWNTHGQVKGKAGKALIVAILTSTSVCHLNASAFDYQERL